MDGETSAILAGSVFRVAKADFEKHDPDIVRARGAGAALQFLL